MSKIDKHRIHVSSNISLIVLTKKKKQYDKENHTITVPTLGGVSTANKKNLGHYSVSSHFYA